MKFKYFTFGLISILLCCCFSFVVVNNGEASDRVYDISILDASYEYLKTIGSGSQTTFEFYKITVVLHNSGPDKSDNMTLEIEDPDNLVPIRVNYTFMPDETKTFVFGDNNNFMIQGTGDHLVNISVYQENESESNLDFKKLILNRYGTTTEDKSTPGFELILFPISLMIFLLLKRKRK